MPKTHPFKARFAMSGKLKGIVPPVITPLTEDGQIDCIGLKTLLEHILDGGVHGLFILGTTGEGPALGYELQKKMIGETCALVGGRVPILVGISAAAMNDSVKLAQIARDSGACAAVAAPPCYFSLGEPELIDYYETLARKIPLPLYLYNMPAMTKVCLKPSTVIHLANVPGIIGYKDSSGSMPDLHEVILGLRGRDDFSIFVGPEELLGEAVLFGADGGVTGGANLNPRLFVSMYEAAVRGDIPEMRRLQGQIYQQRKLYSIGHHQSSIVKGIKCALSIKKICSDYLAEPFNHFEEKEKNEVRKILDTLPIP